MDIFKWLNDSSTVKSHKINKFTHSDSGYYLNVEIEIIDLSQLYFKEYFHLTKRKYSFHWQKVNGNLIIRWDNPPHFPQISTFPHHKHIENGLVEESHDISIDEIMIFIKKKIESI